MCTATTAKVLFPPPVPCLPRVQLYSNSNAQTRAGEVALSPLCRGGEKLRLTWSRVFKLRLLAPFTGAQRAERANGGYGEQYCSDVAGCCASSRAHFAPHMEPTR